MWDMGTGRVDAGEGDLGAGQSTGTAVVEKTSHASYGLTVCKVSQHIVCRDDSFQIGLVPSSLSFLAWCDLSYFLLPLPTASISGSWFPCVVFCA